MPCKPQANSLMPQGGCPEAADGRKMDPSRWRDEGVKMSSAAPTFKTLIEAGPLRLLGGPGVVLPQKPARRGAARHAQRIPEYFQVKYRAVENLGKFLIESPQRLMRLIQINERTAQRRRERGALSPEESDRIARVARVSQRAIDALGDAGRAREWLKRPNRALQEVAPLDLLGTDAGSERVTDELGRIEYGDLY